MDNFSQRSQVQEGDKNITQKQSPFELTDLQPNTEKEKQRLLNLSGTSSDSGFEEESESDQVFFKPFNTDNRNHQQTPNLNQISANTTQNRRFQNSGESNIEDGSTSAANGNNYEFGDKDNEDIDEDIRRDALLSVPKPIPMITSQYSLKPDMMFGWKPKMNIHGAPIPLYFDYEQFDIPINPQTNQEYDITFYGNRFKDSIEMHKAYSSQQSGGKAQNDSYRFKFPPNMNVIEAMAGAQRRKREEQPREFLGMNPQIISNEGIIDPISFKKPSLIFDSSFECGNLDMAIQIKDLEYDLYMRVDSNTRGHHQWFNFIVQNKNLKGKIRFNIVNFTKNASLYHQGMKISIFSQKEFEQKQSSQQINQNQGWIKGGDNIVYKLSKLSSVPFGSKLTPEQIQYMQRSKKYFQLSFDYDFTNENDKVQFAYSIPYTYSKLYNLLKKVNKDHLDYNPDPSQQFIKETQLCKSISGLEVPLLTITSRVNKQNFEEIDPSEFQVSNGDQNDGPPINKYKKYMIVCSRVHPGETNASYIMQGFINFITSPTNQEAIELRKRIVFKIVPITNPDGVIIGNYRTSLCGNDLNRQFITPNTKLHPTVCSIKAMVSNIISSAKEPESISAFIDIHGHSRKKSIFIYGPYFPLHNERYLKMRVLPKLLSERTEMFRFYSCKFRIQKSKLKAARVVLWKEFGIMNCFTLEASFSGYITKERQTMDLTTENLEKMGEILGNGFYEYQTLVEEDEKQKLILKQQLKKKKKKMKAKDIVQAYSKQQEQQIQGLQKQVTVQKQEIQSLDKFFSSDIDERRNSLKGERSQSLAQNQQQQEQQKTNGNISNQKRASSFSSKPPLQSKNLSSLIVNNQPPQKIEKSSGQNSSKHSGIGKQKAVFDMPLVVSDIEAEPKDQSTTPVNERKDFIIKKHKSKIQKKETQNKNNGNQKRTLKSIYKLLKRDVKQMAIATEKLQGDHQIHSSLGNNPSALQRGYSSDSEDSDEDADDCCEGDDSGGEDLSAGELEELQGDIILAIENFDKVFNEDKTKKVKKKSIQKVIKKDDNGQVISQNIKIGIDKNGQNVILSQKDQQTKLSQTREKQTDQINLKMNQSSQNTSFIKTNNKKQSQLVQQTSNTNKSSRQNPQQQEGSISYAKYILSVHNQNTTSGKLSLGPLYGEKINNSGFAINPLQNQMIQSVVDRPSQKPMQQVYTGLTSKNKAYSKLMINENSRSSLGPIPMSEQQQLVYSNVQNNVKQMLKYTNGNNQRNPLLVGQGQLMIQSKSQDRCKPSEEHINNKKNQLAKSFEGIGQQQLSKSTNPHRAEYVKSSQIQQVYDQLPRFSLLNSQSNGLSSRSSRALLLQPDFQDSNPAFINQQQTLSLQKLDFSNNNFMHKLDQSNIYLEGNNIIRNSPSKLKQKQVTQYNKMISPQGEKQEFSSSKSSQNRQMSFIIQGQDLNYVQDKYNQQDQNFSSLARKQMTLNPRHQSHNTKPLSTIQHMNIINPSTQNHSQQRVLSQYSYQQRQTMELKQQSVNKDQSTVIQNIIIANSKQRIQSDKTSTPNSQREAVVAQTQGQQERKLSNQSQESQCLQKGNGRKMSRKSKQQQQNSQESTSYLNSGSQSQPRRTITYQQVRVSDIKDDPYFESDQQKRIKSRGSKRLKNDQMLITNEEDKQNKHKKKQSIEYEKILKNYQQSQEQQDIFGNQYIYNLRPLKDMIVNNLSHMKYIKSHIGTHIDKTGSFKKGGSVPQR